MQNVKSCIESRSYITCNNRLVVLIENESKVSREEAKRKKENIKITIEVF